MASNSFSDSTFIQQLEEGLKGDRQQEDAAKLCNKRAERLGESSPASSVRSISTPTSDPRRPTYPSNNHNSKEILTALIVILGAAAAAAFMSFGFHATNHDMEGRFENNAETISYHVLSAWNTYEMFALWIHQACHKSVERNFDIDPYDDIASHLGYCSRKEFRRLYEYISSQGGCLLVGSTPPEHHS